MSISFTFPRELVLDKPRVHCWSSFMGYPQAVTQIYVHNADGLQNQDSNGGKSVIQA